VPGRVLGPRLRAGFDVGFLLRGPHYLPCLHHNGPLHQLPDKLPTLDVFRGLSAVLYPLSLVIVYVLDYKFGWS